VGTPGRIIDHLQRGSLMLHDTSYLVLDETDRMLDMGFEDQILQILKYLPLQRQTLLFSATLPPQILKLSEKYLKNPVRIEVGETNKAADRIDQMPSLEPKSHQRLPPPRADGLRAQEERKPQA
jgi:superfamily II DNA/RNA helicase